MTVFGEETREEKKERQRTQMSQIRGSPLKGLPSRGKLLTYVPMEEQPLMKVNWVGVLGKRQQQKKTETFTHFYVQLTNHHTNNRNFVQLSKDQNLRNHLNLTQQTLSFMPFVVLLFPIVRSFSTLFFFFSSS